MLPFETRRCYGDITDPSTVVSVPGTGAQSTITVTVDLTDIVDLTHPEQADLIETNAQELTGDWDKYPTRKPPFGWTSTTHSGMAPTQLLGQALFTARFKGLITFSAAVPYFRNLVVFPQLLLGSGCTVKHEWTDPHGTLQQLKIP